MANFPGVDYLDVDSLFSEEELMVREHVDTSLPRLVVLSQREIAQRLGISQVQGSRSLTRALERCRRHLEPAAGNGVTSVVVPPQESYTPTDGTSRATG